jgi:hypothetical protein
MIKALRIWALLRLMPQDTYITKAEGKWSVEIFGYGINSSTDLLTALRVALKKYNSIILTKE